MFRYSFAFSSVFLATVCAVPTVALVQIDDVASALTKNKLEGKAPVIVQGANRNGVLQLAPLTGPTHVTGAYRVIETGPTTRRRDVVIDGLIADDLQRGGIRLRGKLAGIIIRNSSFVFRVTPQTAPHLPACIEAGDKADSQIEGLLVQNVSCEGFQLTMDPQRYWNGDGPTFEANVSRLVLDNVTSRNSTDACFDIKPVVSGTRIEAEGCKRNVRFWRSATFDQITSITPVKRGGTGMIAHFWIKGNNAAPPVIRIGKLIIRSTNAAPIFMIEDGAALVTVGACEFQVPAGTLLKFGGAKGNLLTLGPGCKAS